MKNIFFTFLSLMLSQLIFSQVGIGTTTPDATLHVVGTTVLPSAGATVTLYSNDFSSGGVAYNVNGGNTCTTGTSIWNVNVSEPLGVDCSECTGDFAMIEYSSSCIQNQTLVEGSFIPTTTTVDISFDYGYDDYDSGDSFTATLYNETTSSVAATFFSLTVDADNANYTGSHTVVIGETYSIRFQYIGDDDLGAALDNILVQETTAGGGSSSYTFRLEDGQQQDGYVLTSDANGYATWKAASGGSGANQTLSISGNNLTISGAGGNTVIIPSIGGGTYSFENGLALSGSTARLGGDLTQNTFIDLLTRDLWFEGTSTGDIYFEGNNRLVVQTNFGDDYILFGDGFPSVDLDDGQTFNDTGNTSYTKDFLAGYHNGSSGGSAFATGSIEYLVDGTDELFLEASSFNPMSDLRADLGSANPFSSGPARNWEDVYADAFVAAAGTTYNRVSGTAPKFERGLDDIMKLNPISYKKQSINIGSRMSNSSENETKLGFYAAELMNVIPEAVKSSDWFTLKEGEDRVKMNIPNPGIIYNQIIPVVVKAIQEQQEQIEVLKTTIEALKEQNELLMKLIKDKK